MTRMCLRRRPGAPAAIQSARCRTALHRPSQYTSQFLACYCGAARRRITRLLLASLWPFIGFFMAFYWLLNGFLLAVLWFFDGFFRMAFLRWTSVAVAIHAILCTMLFICSFYHTKHYFICVGHFRTVTTASLSPSAAMSSRMSSIFTCRPRSPRSDTLHHIYYVVYINIIYTRVSRVHIIQ